MLVLITITINGKRLVIAASIILYLIEALTKTPADILGRFQNMQQHSPWIFAAKLLHMFNKRLSAPFELMLDWPASFHLSLKF